MKTKGIIVAIFTTLLISGGLTWFGYRNPQNFLQYTQSHLKYGKPVTGVANGIVFLGDSITKFEDWNVLFGVSSITNAGFPGNTTSNVISRIDGVLSAKPQKIFLMVGINDLLNGGEVDQVVKNYTELLNKIKEQSPSTLVYVQSVLPVNNGILKSETVNNQEISSLNGKLKLLSEERGNVFIDLNSHFHGSNEQMRSDYSWDGLHPNSHGYAVWRNLIVQYIR